jgi:alpha-L-fucosidase 2
LLAKLRSRAKFSAPESGLRTAGVEELLLQSHAGEIALLPALPTAWRKGSVQGLRARGGVEVDMEWSDGRIIAAEIFALRDGDHTFRVPKSQKVTAVKRTDGVPAKIVAGSDGQTFSMAVRQGERYRLEPVMSLESE